MKTYKHTQIGYLITSIAIVVLVYFSWVQIMARLETPSVDSGTNFAITAIMVLVIFILASFSTLTITIDEKFLKIRFGLGIYSKKFLLSEIASVKKVKNPWYFGWGIRLWLWPKIWIYNVSGFNAIEFKTKNGDIYRIGTDDLEELTKALRQNAQLCCKIE